MANSGLQLQLQQQQETIAKRLISQAHTHTHYYAQRVKSKMSQMIHGAKLLVIAAVPPHRHH